MKVALQCRWLSLCGGLVWVLIYFLASVLVFMLSPPVFANSLFFVTLELQWMEQASSPLHSSSTLSHTSTECRKLIWTDNLQNWDNWKLWSVYVHRSFMSVISRWQTFCLVGWFFVYVKTTLLLCLKSSGMSQNNQAFPRMIIARKNIVVFFRQNLRDFSSLNYETLRNSLVTVGTF